MLTATHLATVATVYAASRQISLSALGDSIIGDHGFFKRLITGGDCTTRNATKATAWFVENWPADVAWPDGIPRPQSEEIAA